MSLKPCLDCGELSEGSRCPDHTHDALTSAYKRANKAKNLTRLDRTGKAHTRWTKLSRLARKRQSFCLVCGLNDEQLKAIGRRLEADHTPEARRREEQGLPVRLQDVQVLCNLHNVQAGAVQVRMKEEEANGKSEFQQ